MIGGKKVAYWLQRDAFRQGRGRQMISKLKTTVGIAAVRQTLLAAAALFVVATPAAAAGIGGGGLGANYMFPDGSLGFGLNVSLPAGDTDLTSDGLLLPAVLVAFNPQPDPPVADKTSLSLSDPTQPMFSNLMTGAYAFEMSFLNLLPNGCDPTNIPAPDAGGHTGFSCTGTLGDEANVTVAVALTFSGPVSDWVAFNPQPDPPGDVGAYTMTFQGALGENGGADPFTIMAITVNGTSGDFNLPEPGTLSLFGTALIGLAAWRRRRRAS
jgi:hypothetical protein